MPKFISYLDLKYVITSEDREIVTGTKTATATGNSLEESLKNVKNTLKNLEKSIPEKIKGVQVISVATQTQTATKPLKTCGLTCTSYSSCHESCNEGCPIFLGNCTPK